MQRVTSIQNYAATMANMKELSCGFKAFWEQLPGGDDLQARFREFQVGPHPAADLPSWGSSCPWPGRCWCVIMMASVVHVAVWAMAAESRSCCQCPQAAVASSRGFPRQSAKLHAVMCCAVQVWSNNYPEQVRGVEGSRFTSPETLQAFNEHCAAFSASAKSTLYMRGKGLV